MSPVRKRAGKGARKTRKKVTRKAPAKKAPKAGAKKKAKPASARTAAARKTTRKAAKKAPKRDAKKRAAEPSAAARSKPAKVKAQQPKAAAARRRAKPARRQPGQGFAQPLESAEKKPGLGAKWACFSCGAKFYDLNRPDPICPKCHTDQREQPAKPSVPVSPPAGRRPAAAPISRLLDEEETADPAFEEDSDAETAAELDIGKFEEGEGYLEDSEFSDDADD
jgi:hypothetical protein